MKKILLLAGMLSAACFCFAEDLSKVQPEVQFVKGNISDKIAAVKRSATTDESSLAVKALDFIIENESVLKQDREASSLAVAAVLSWPQEYYSKDPELTLRKFNRIFYVFEDKTVKISVFEKLASLHDVKEYSKCSDFAVVYLEYAVSEKLKADETLKKAVEVLGKIGNGKAFNVLYSSLKNGMWTELKSQVQFSLSSIADKSLNEILNTIRTADVSELKLLYSIFVKNPELSQTIRAEVAENILKKLMVIQGDAAKKSSEINELCLDCAKVLYDSNWTRASDTARQYFDLARKEYEAKTLSEENFTKVIQYVERLASRSAVKPFSDFMDEMNRATEADNPPSKAVVLSIINALGTLGDKSAFDCLLYVTYLNYPEEVVSKARDALTRLKW